MTPPLWRRAPRHLAHPSRRDLIRASILAGAGLAAAGLDPSRLGRALAEPALTGPLTISSWPYYIDKETIPNFEKKFGVDVKYIEDINDNDSLFGKIAGSLQTGHNPSRDIIVPTNFLVARLIRLKWVEKFSREEVPNLANLEPVFAHASYDPEREYSLPWATILTGLAYNIDKTGRELTSLTDIFDPAFKGHVSMLTEMRDTLALVMLGMGIDPSTATFKEAEAAVAKIKENVDSGQIRQFFGNDYGAALARGDIWVAFAWSGDIVQLQKDNPNIRFIRSKEGYLRAEDDMVIPLKAAHREAALAWMNYVYDPEVFARITATIQYIPPVAGTREFVRKLNPALADNPLIYPSPDELAKSHPFVQLSPADEHQWSTLFQTAIGH
jgi:spermidine/putrescine transport system substrate-binding protein